MEEIKNKIYELEGLLELAGMRPEKLADLKPLIGKRIAEITMLWAGMDAEEMPAPKPQRGPEPEDEDLPGPEDEDLPGPEDEDLPDPEDLPEPDDEDLQECESQPEAADLPERTTADSTSAAAAAPAAVPAFRLSINDRYRFARVLAGGDMKRLDRITAVVASLPDLQAVEEYVYGDLVADADDPEVEDFLELVALSKK